MRPASFNEIKLIWRPKPHTLRLVVGTLSMVGSRGSFVYDGENIEEAKALGFSGYPGMYDLSAEYNGQAFHSFVSRLPSRERPELEKILEGWGANLSMSDFQLLGLTFATLPTDLFELIPVILPVQGTEFYTNLAGIKAYADSEIIRQLEPGAELDLELDPTNEFDGSAVAVLHQSNRVAFIKRVHCESVCAAIKQELLVSAQLVRVRMNRVIKEVVIKISYK
jgi:hypothetical protein